MSLPPLRVLFFRDLQDPDTWVAQALEHDIAAHGGDIEQAKVAFERTLSAYIQLAHKYQEEPLAKLVPAPRVFFDIWQAVAKPKVQAELIRSAHLYMLPVVTHERVQGVK